MFDGCLDWFSHHLTLEGDIRWGDPDEGEPISLKEIVFAYAWDAEAGTPTELKVGISGTLGQIDGLAHRLVPPPPPGAAWEELLETLDRGIHEVGYDRHAALLLHAPSALLEVLAARLAAAQATSLDDALDNDELWNLLFSFEHYEMEGVELELAA